MRGTKGTIRIGRGDVDEKLYCRGEDSKTPEIEH